MFGKRIHILTFYGFKIGIDFSWFFIAILLSWTLAAAYFPYFYPALAKSVYWTMGILGMLGLFICVVLHELGHAIVAKRFGIPIEQITLFIFGGVAEIKQEPKTPKSELLMAIAGPIVSFLLSGILYFIAYLGEKFGWSIIVNAVAHYLALVNLLLALFNLVPAFPLDGGRIFRSLLWMWKKNLGWATRISSRVGTGFALLLLFLGFFSFLGGNLLAGIWWFILGLFLYRASSTSRMQYLLKNDLEKEKVRKFMSNHPIAAAPQLSLQEFIDKHLYKSGHHLYPVIEEEKLLGYISLMEVKAYASEEWPKVSVKAAMVPLSKVQTVSPESSAYEAFNLMQENGAASLLVVKDGKLVGIVTVQDLLKLFSIKMELEAR